MVEMSRDAFVQIRRPDIVMPAYYAEPPAARPNTPGIVLVMHGWGVDTSIRNVVDRFAQAGFAVIAPDLYARYGTIADEGSEMSAVRPYIEKLMTAPAQVDGDIRACALWLKSAHPQGKVGVTGFCMGGAIALRQAVTNDDIFSVSGVWYGKPSGIDPTKVHIPVVGSYGELDKSIPADEVRAFRKVLRAQNDIVIYPTSGHAFFDDRRSAYVAPAAQDSWRRTIAFFTKYLKS